MSISLFAIFLTLANAIILLAIPVAIGVYVWRDAKRRGMSAGVWTAIAVLVPALIGFIIYLVVRTGHSSLQCPICSTRVKEDFVVCPGCSAKLRPSCPSCSAAVELEWKVCPRCASSLHQKPDDITQPVIPKDRAIGPVIAIVVILPLILLVVLAVSMTAQFSGGSCSMKDTTIERYANEQEDPQVRDQVLSWIEDLPSDVDRAYALRYDSITESGNESFFLVYVPGADGQNRTEFGQSSNIFGTTLKLELERTGESGALFNIVSSADNPPNLSITLDGKRVSCAVTIVDFNPTTYRIVPDHVPIVSLETDEYDADIDLVAVSDALGIDALGGTLEASVDSYGGFRGDGMLFAQIAYPDDRILHQIEVDPTWKELPLSEVVEVLTRGVSDETGQYGPYLTDTGAALFPQVENGYFYFRDRHDQSADPTDDSQVLKRASINVTVAIYDADSRTLYYGELDT